MVKQENRTMKYTSGQCRKCCPFIRQISQLVLMLESSGKEGKVRKRKRQPAAAQTLTIVDMDASGFVDKPEKVARKKPDLAKYMSEFPDEDDDEDNEGVILTASSCDWPPSRGLWPKDPSVESLNIAMLIKGKMQRARKISLLVHYLE